MLYHLPSAPRKDTCTAIDFHGPRLLTTTSRCIPRDSRLHAETCLFCSPAPIDLSSRLVRVVCAKRERQEIFLVLKSPFFFFSANEKAGQNARMRGTHHHSSNPAPRNGHSPSQHTTTFDLNKAPRRIRVHPHFMLQEASSGTTITSNTHQKHTTIGKRRHTWQYELKLRKCNAQAGQDSKWKVALK